MTTVTISLPLSFWNEVEKRARSEQRNHSDLLREAFRLYLKVRGAKTPPSRHSRVQQAVAMQDTLAKVASGSDQDSTTVPIISSSKMASPPLHEAQNSTLWADMDELAAKIGKKWPPLLSAAEAVEEGRRTL